MTNGEVLALPEGTINASMLPGAPVAGMSIGASREAPISAPEAAKEFEAYVLKLLLSEMRRTVGSDGLFPGGGSGVYQSIFEDALARRAAEAGTFGLAEQLLRDWGTER